MDHINHLVEQHFRESESRLRHVDEMMKRAQAARAELTVPQEVEGKLAQIQQDRDRLEQELHDYRGRPVSDPALAVKHGEGLKGVLETMGQELEKALTAIFGQSGR